MLVFPEPGTEKLHAFCEKAKWYEDNNCNGYNVLLGMYLLKELTKRSKSSLIQLLFLMFSACKEKFLKFSSSK